MDRQRMESEEKKGGDQGPLRSPGSRGPLALILGMLGLIVCQLFSPLAWYVGYRELRAIRSGDSTTKDERLAKAGMILGIIGTVLLLVGLAALVWLWYRWEEVVERVAPYLSR